MISYKVSLQRLKPRGQDWINLSKGHISPGFSGKKGAGGRCSLGSGFGRRDTQCSDLVEKVVIHQRLDSMMLEVFPNLIGSIIL